MSLFLIKNGISRVSMATLILLRDVILGTYFVLCGEVRISHGWFLVTLMKLLLRVRNWEGGCRNRPKQQMLDFKKVLTECELRDLGFTSPMFTWCNKTGGLSTISEWLDLFVANSIWCQLYSQATVIHGTTTYSDHLPILLELDSVHRFERGIRHLDLKQCGLERKVVHRL